MDEAGTSYTWFPNGDVRTVSKAMPALVRHDGTGREMFFNSVVAALQGWVDVRNDPRKAIVYGDGSDLDDEARAALDDVAEYMRENRVAFQWQAGDVLLIDNYKALHSRETFVPPRRVLASLWDDALPEPRNGLRVIRDVLPLPLRNRASNLGSFLRRVQKKGAGAAMRLRGGGSTAAAVGPGVAHSGARVLRLRTGAMMPAVGLGVWKIPKDVCAEAVVSAIRQGYRHIDSACDYGNEVEVGEGIRRAIAEGIVTRDELWVTSKLWNTYHAKEHVEPACRRTLSDLGLDYVDLYLVHFPIALKYVPFETRYPPEWIYDPSCAEPKMELVHVPIQETWSAMEGLVSQGLAKNIGVCNFNVAGVRDLLSYATVPPAVLQVELHPYNQQPNLVRYCAEQDITVRIRIIPPHIANPATASPHQPKAARALKGLVSPHPLPVPPVSSSHPTLASNLLGLAPPSPHHLVGGWLLASQITLTLTLTLQVTGFSPLGSSSYVELGMATPTDSALTDPTIVSLADAKGVSPAQLILKWGLQRGLSIIPKSTKPERLAQNLDLEGVELSDDDMKTMAALDKGRRFNDPGDFCQGMGAFVPIYD